MFFPVTPLLLLGLSTNALQWLGVAELVARCTEHCHVVRFLWVCSCLHYSFFGVFSCVT